MAQSPAAARLQRFIWISAGGVGDSRVQASPIIRRMIGLGGIGAAYRDLERAEAVLHASEVPALAVRPVTLTGGAPTGSAGPVSRYSLFSAVRRSDVARWMLDAADGGTEYPDSTVLLGRAS